MSKGDVFKASVENIDDDFQHFVGRVLGEKTDTERPIVTALKKRFGKLPELGVCSKESTRIISKTAWQQLYNFYSTELLKGNKHIEWVGRNMSIKEHVKNNPQKYNEGEKKLLTKVVNKGATLGDIPALQALKQKFENGK